MYTYVYTYKDLCYKERKKAIRTKLYYKVDNT